MCFSATASFITAGLTGAAGLATVAHATSSRQYPLAAFPLIFSVQQTIEGVLWLTLPAQADPALSRFLATSFLVLAEAAWPFLVPIAILLIEPSAPRRLLFGALWAAGTILAVNALVRLLEAPTGVSIAARGLQYWSDFPYLSWWPVLYGLSTLVPLLLSSHRFVQFFGGLVLAGYGVSFYAYSQTLTSVWCFFAAAGSLVLLFQFVCGFGPAGDAAGAKPLPAGEA